MKNKKILILILAFIIVFALVTTFTSRPSVADVGNGVDWDADDGGGGGGWTGGDSWTGSSSSSDGSNLIGSLIEIAFYLLIYNPILFIIIVIVLVVIAVTYAKFSKHTNVNQQQYRPSPVSQWPTKDNEDAVAKVLERDPNFSKGVFLSTASNVFVALQNAWTNKDWKSIRAFESDYLFNQHETQLNDYIEKKITNIVEEISVRRTVIEDYTVDSANQYMSVILKARYRDYVIDDKTGKVIKGDKNKRYMMTYRMTFMRTIDAVTDVTRDAEVTTCPNCGANLSINQHGVCDYCGSEVSKGALKWILVSLEPLEQVLL